METVQQVYGLSPRSNSPSSHPLVLPGRVGLELELENIRVSYGRHGHWNVVDEDSLRDGVEFIMSGDGKEGLHIIESINELMEILNTNSFSPSWRCSTHLHVDVRDMTLPQIKKFTLAMIVLEEIMYDSAGAHRKNSNFCMPYSVAEELGMILGRNWHKEDLRSFLDGVNSEWTKYAGMNFLPTQRLGTIEFRNAEPKHTRGTLLRLINRNLAILNYAKNYEGSELDFVNSLTDPSFVKDLLCMGVRRNYVINSEKLNEGLINALDVIHYTEFRPTINDVPDIPVLPIRDDAVGLAKAYSEDMNVVFDEVSKTFEDISKFFEFLKYYFSSPTNWGHILCDRDTVVMSEWWNTLSQSHKEIILSL